MKKSNLLKFINKYHLGKQCNSVTWNSNDSTVSVNFITEDTSCGGRVTTTNSVIKLDDGKYHIYETNTLAAMLGVVGEEITAKTVRIGNDISAIHVTDGKTKLVYATAVAQAIPKAPRIEFGDAEPVLEFSIDSEFIEKFSKARSALERTNTFALVDDKDGLHVVLGYSENENTNSIAIPVQTTINEGLNEPLFFHAQHAVSAFAANKEAPGTCVLFNNGWLRFTFKTDEFEAVYCFGQTQGE